MRTIRPQKRSVSPFGVSVAPAADPFARLREAVLNAFPPVADNVKPRLQSIEDAAFVPSFLEKITDAPANDAPRLDELCQFLLRFRESFEERKIGDVLYETMLQLFDRKTELFMIDHQDRAHCERLGLSVEYRDLVLFAKERDALVGRYFAPVTETRPGLFSEFVTRWVETDNLDRVLHFLDFCMGSKNPTFEHYLLFTHPALARVVGNKAQLRALLEKTRPLLTKLTSPTWEQDVRQTLAL